MDRRQITQWEREKIIRDDWKSIFDDKELDGVVAILIETRQ